MTVTPGQERVPTPDDGVLRPYASLNAAMQAHRIPVENRPLIRTFTAAVGVSHYFGCSSYIKAVRSGDGPALNITSGWSNGFVSEQEARASVGDAVDCWPSDRGTGFWGVTHPVNSIRDGSAGLKHEVRDYGYCPTCFLALLPSGACGSCSL